MWRGRHAAAVGYCGSPRQLPSITRGPTEHDVWVVMRASGPSTQWMTNFVSFSAEYRITLPPRQASNMLAFLCRGGCMKKAAWGDGGGVLTAWSLLIVVSRYNRWVQPCTFKFVPGRRMMICPGIARYHITRFMRGPLSRWRHCSSVARTRKGSDQTNKISRLLTWLVSG